MHMYIFTYIYIRATNHTQKAGNTGFHHKSGYEIGMGGNIKPVSYDTQLHSRRTILLLASSRRTILFAVQKTKPKKDLEFASIIMCTGVRVCRIHLIIHTCRE